MHNLIKITEFASLTRRIEDLEEKQREREDEEKEKEKERQQHSY